MNSLTILSTFLCLVYIFAHCFSCLAFEEGQQVKIVPFVDPIAKNRELMLQPHQNRYIDNLLSISNPTVSRKPKDILRFANLYFNAVPTEAKRQLPQPLTSTISAYCINKILEASDKAATMGLDKIRIPLGCLPYWILRNPNEGSQCGCEISGFVFVAASDSEVSATTAATTTNKTMSMNRTEMTTTSHMPGPSSTAIEKAMKFCSAASCKILSRIATGFIRNTLPQTHTCSCLFEGGLRSTNSKPSPTCECSTICNVPQQFTFGSMVRTVTGQSSYLCAFSVMVTRAMTIVGGNKLKMGQLVSCHCYMKGTGNSHMNIPNFHCDCYNSSSSKM